MEMIRQFFPNLLELSTRDESRQALRPPEKHLLMPAADVQGIDFHIVGDRFGEFADGNTVVTFSQAAENIQMICALAQGIQVGQGIGSEDVALLQSGIERSFRADQIEFVEWVSERAPRALLCKQEARDVLISLPKRSTRGTFTSHLIIDGKCSQLPELSLCDYVSGDVLLEAAKQMFLACVVKDEMVPHHISQLDRPRFSLASLNVHFTRFVFPLAAALHLRVQEVKLGEHCARGTVEVEITQLGQSCCRIEMTAAAYESRCFRALEARSAMRVRARSALSRPGFIGQNPLKPSPVRTTP